jgi:hypothetical protein
VSASPLLFATPPMTSGPSRIRSGTGPPGSRSWFRRLPPFTAPVMHASREWAACGSRPTPRTHRSYGAPLSLAGLAPP